MASSPAWTKHHRLRLYSGLLTALVCALLAPIGYRLATVERSVVPDASARLQRLASVASKRRSLAAVSLSSECGAVFAAGFAIRLVELEVLYDVRVSSGHPLTGVFKNGRILIGCKGDDGKRAAELAAIVSFRASGGEARRESDELDGADSRRTFLLRLLVLSPPAEMQALRDVREEWALVGRGLELLSRDLADALEGDGSAPLVESSVSLYPKIRPEALNETLLSGISDLDSFRQDSLSDRVRKTVQLVVLLDAAGRGGGAPSAFRLAGWGTVVLVASPEGFQSEMLLQSLWSYVRDFVYDLGQGSAAPEERAWRVEAARRRSLFRRFREALKSLQSSWSLMERVTRVPVTSRVAGDFDRALSLLEREARLLNSPDGKLNLETEDSMRVEEREGEEHKSLTARLRRAREASALAEGVATDESLVPPIHLSEQNLLALFAPMLVPIALPLVLGLLNEAVQRRRRGAAEGPRKAG